MAEEIKPIPIPAMVTDTPTAPTPVPVPIATTPTPTLAPVAPPTASSVYSAENIAQTATTPVSAPNPALDEYNAYMNTPEMIAARAKTAELQQAINAEKQGLRNTTTGLQYQNTGALGTTGASINLVGTQVGRASDLASNRLAGLGENLTAQQTLLNSLEATQKEKYNIIQAEKSKLQSLIAQTGGQAGITTSDTYETAVQKAYQWEQNEKKKLEKEADKKAEDERKKSLKSEIAKLGGSTKNKKGGSLDLKGLEKEYERLTGEQYKKQSSREEQEWNMKIATFNKSMSGGGSASDIKTANENYIYSGLSSAQRGEDGFVDPSVWRSALKEWTDAGGSSSEFFSKFGGKVNDDGERTGGFINPNDI
jgi:hypothetical protein